ncbi:MAG TPA: DNA replication and repair protein RecF, partial [Thermodesulfobacteriota bacterium]|nr:DNA replication and repair protein RecF [Thermodesulfobacteriota bacterium]
MRLTRLALTDFRNYRSAVLEFPARVTLFVGGNAQGKSNLLEAIYLLGTFKSFKTQHNLDIIRWSADAAAVTGTVVDGGVERRVEVLLDAQGRRARINGKPVRSLQEFFGACSVVLFAPEDLGLVKGPPAFRRRFLDRAIFTGSPGYLPGLKAYLGAVQHKQALLRAAAARGAGRGPGLAEEAGEAWDATLVRYGVEVIRARARLVRELTPHLAAAYRRLAAGPGGGEAGLQYRPGAPVDPW